MVQESLLKPTLQHFLLNKSITMSADDEETTLPSTMKRLVVMEPGKDVKSCKIEVQQVPVPKPSSSQVLIKVVAAAVNPSDYGSWFRCRPEQCPFATGKEGCGIVVATGGGLATYRCPVGTKVGFIGLKDKQGSYSEYVVADAISSVFAMPDDVPIEDAASFFVNPYTALAILDTVKNTEGSPAFVHTAAASQLGQMLVKVAPSEGVQLINVVRRQEQAELLRKLGAEHVVVTGDSDDWKESLVSKIKELGATVAMDAVAGEMTGDLLKLLPKKGSVYVYGGLAGKVSNVDPMDMIYHEKKLKGFFLSSWIQQGSLMSKIFRMVMASRKVNEGLKDGGWSSSQFLDTSLESAHADIVKLLDSSITGKKLRIRFDN